MSNLTEVTMITLPVDTAVERCKNWRDFISANVVAENQPKIPRAVYISRADIMAIADEMNADQTIVGARAYFTLNTPWAEDIHNDVKFVIVPVVEAEGYPNGKDLVYIPADGNSALGADPIDDDSNVYDFTRPCPDYCDTNSELFGDGITTKC